MKKVTLNFLLIASFSAYVVYLGYKSAQPEAVMNAKKPDVSLIVKVPATSGTEPPPAPVPMATPRGKFRDGTYTGDVVDVYYGNVEVQAIVSGGRLTNVQSLQYPNDSNYSRMINPDAMPVLASEAVQAQSAQVDAYSGASATSAGFVQSLASALTKAAN
jgi:uncharacterized protein with FMN-binding domain